jgi:1-deoxy-D-xylulose-5-phosphate reductoisomerase
MPELWPATHGELSYISQPPSQQWAQGKRSLTLLGSTGSIGSNTLKVVAAAPELFDIVALAGAHNVQKLAEQAARWRPRYLGVFNQAGADVLKKLLPAGYTPEIVIGAQGYARLAALPEVNTVLSAQVGAAGLRGTVAAALAGKVICLANKESLVLAGGLVRELCRRTGAVILPVDSEHNAIFQCLAGRAASHVKKIILTASGGPFRGQPRSVLAHVTREQALQHPNWSMGAKITIDSATLMNKGLEVIEAWHLYGVPLEHIGVLVHPQSLVHSLVEFHDGALMAQLGTPDMRMAIAYCAAWPHCIESGVAPLDLASAGALTFLPPDEAAFPCLALAKKVLQQGMEAAIVMNAANEVAVQRFLDKQCRFLDIPALIEAALDARPQGQQVRPLPAQCDHDVLTKAVGDILQDIENIDSSTREACAALARTL